MSATRGLRLITAATVISLLLAGSVGNALAEEKGEGIQPIPFVHNVTGAPAPVTGAVWANGPDLKQGVAICTTPTSNAANVNTDCESKKGPHNETSIAVNPTNANNIIGGANDYQLGLNPGGHVGQTILSRAHVSFDGGKTWSLYPINSNSAYQATGDPAIAFDASGHAYYATLGFRFAGPFSGTNPDIVVADSGDGGITWRSNRVAGGTGSFGSVGKFLDKEYIAAWGNGNALVTWGLFLTGQKGAVINVKIYASVTHDFGATWSSPRLISGDLEASFVPVPTVAADGRTYVAFMNTFDFETGRDTYEVVEVSPATGERVAGPFDVALVIDGFEDYPVALGRQTYEDSVFRSWAAGNITADPTNAAHLAVVWSDMRNTPHPVAVDPYEADTNSDVIVSESFDRGRTWSTPIALARANDQFQPWGAFDASGALRIGTFDRATDADNHKYDYSLANQTGPGSFSWDVVSTQQSDPTKGNRWFAVTEEEDFPRATAFIGDYSNIAAVPGTTHIVAYWTDLREDVTFAGVTAKGQDAYFAMVP